MIASWSWPASCSSGVKGRPTGNGARSVSKKSREIDSDITRSEVPGPRRIGWLPGSKAQMFSKETLACGSQSSKSGAERRSVRFGCLRSVRKTETRFSDSGNGRGFQSCASSTLKIAVFAPMPRASVSTAMAVKPGFLRSMRAPKRTSREKMFEPGPAPGVMGFFTERQFIAKLPLRGVARLDPAPLPLRGIPARGVPGERAFRRRVRGQNARAETTWKSGGKFHLTIAAGSWRASGASNFCFWPFRARR